MVTWGKMTPSSPQSSWSHCEAGETQHAGSLKGSIILQNAALIPEDAIIIILTLVRNAEWAYGGCNPLRWVGRQKCVGHKCLWRGGYCGMRYFMSGSRLAKKHFLKCIIKCITSYLVCPVEFVRCLWCHCIHAAGRRADPALVQQILYKHNHTATQAQFNLPVNQ